MKARHAARTLVASGVALLGLYGACRQDPGPLEGASNVAISASVAPSTSAPSPSPSPSADGSAGTLRAPPSPEDHNLFGLVRGANALANEGPARVKSPDGELFAFARPRSEGEAASLWVEHEDGSERRRVFDAAEVSAAASPGHIGIKLGESSALFDLGFSPDGKKIYFQAEGWGTSHALYVADVESGAVRFVHDANGYLVIDRCSDRAQVGRLIILEHRYFDPIPGTAVDWYFLIDERAKRYGMVGPEPENIDRFLAKRCGVGTAPPPPEPQTPPARLLGGRVRCGNYTIKHAPQYFLDGTMLHFFFVQDQSMATPGQPALTMAYRAEYIGDLVAGACPSMK